MPSPPELPQLPTKNKKKKYKKKINTLPHAAAIQLLRAERDNIFNYMPHRQPKTATGIQISSTTTKLENNLRILHALPPIQLCVCVSMYFLFSLAFSLRKSIRQLRDVEMETVALSFNDSSRGGGYSGSLNKCYTEHAPLFAENQMGMEAQENRLHGEK